MKKFIISIIGVIFTMWGLYLLYTTDLTNGLLALILGELIDQSYKDNSK